MTGCSAAATRNSVPTKWLRTRHSHRDLRSTAAVIALSLSLQGCMVGPDYVAPVSHLAPFHNLAGVNGGIHGNPPPLDRWWFGFDDPTLVNVVQLALNQNLDVAASFGRIQQARAAAEATGAALLPTLDFDASATAEHQSIESPSGVVANTVFPGYNRDQREYNVGGAASWELDLAGGLRRNAAAARDEMQAAEAEQAGTRVSVAADAADAYLQVRGLQAQLRVAQDQIDTDAKLLKIVQFRYLQGEAEGREVAQAQALLQQAQATVPALHIALEAQLNRLDVLMGVQPGTYARELDQTGAIPGIPGIGGSNQPLDVLRRRPDIIAAERSLAASNERIGSAIADYYPKISLSGALGFDSLSANHLFTEQAFQPIGTGALQWRLFDFGKVDAEVAQSRGANAVALAQYRLAVLKASEDVEDALITLTQTEIHVSELQGEVASLLRDRDLSQRAYEAGSIPLTDVLDADRQLLVVREELYGSQADGARAAVGVFRALGGGWNAPLS